MGANQTATRSKVRVAPKKRAAAKSPGARHAEKKAAVSAFNPGSLPYQLAALNVGESFIRGKRFPLLNGQIATQAEVQAYLDQQNPILSGSISKVRRFAANRSKKYITERGNYMTARNTAMFVFYAVTRVE